MQQSNKKTIESDILNSREGFHTTKYNLIEYLSKHHFFEDFKNNDFNFEGGKEMVTEHKERLVQTKSEKNEIKEEIKKKSVEIYDLRSEYEENIKTQAILETKCKDLKEEKIMLEESNKEYIEYQKLETELKSTNEELHEIMKELEFKKQQIAKIDLKALKESVISLREKRERLVNIKRKIDGDSIIDDLVLWHSNSTVLLEKLCGYKISSYEYSDSKLHVSFVCNDYKLEIFIKNDKLVDARTNAPFKEFRLLKEYSIMFDDVRYLLIKFRSLKESK